MSSTKYPTTEWDQLTEVIIGDATGARIPDIDISVRTVNYADIPDSELHTIPLPGPYPAKVITEANEDLERFASELKKLGITVKRPELTPTNYYHYCPRDIAVVYGNHCIASPMPIRARNYDKYGLHRIIPGLTQALNYNHIDDLFNIKCVGDPNTLALTEHWPAFDAANVLRAGDDLLYLVSNSGNRAGAEWLSEVLGVKVHLLENVYSYMHIDSTVAFLREGLLLINPERITDPRKQLPAPFNTWDFIRAPEPTDIGHYPGYCNASKWINMNLFSINSRLVVLEEHQENLAIKLNKYGIESMMLPMRQQRTLGGGFHCVTLDTGRA